MIKFFCSWCPLGPEKDTNRITKTNARVPLVKGERNVRDALISTWLWYLSHGFIIAEIWSAFLWTTFKVHALDKSSECIYTEVQIFFVQWCPLGPEKDTNRITKTNARVPLVKGERNVRDALISTWLWYLSHGFIIAEMWLAVLWTTLNVYSAYGQEQSVRQHFLLDHCFF